MNLSNISRLVTIIDPGMISHIGHHRELNLRIAKHLVNRGYRVSIVVGKTYSHIVGDQSDDRIKIIPYFSDNPYELLQQRNNLTTILVGHRLAARRFQYELHVLKVSGIIHFSCLFSYQLHAAVALTRTHQTTACIHHHPLRFRDSDNLLWADTTSTLTKDAHQLGCFVVEEMLANEIDYFLPQVGGVRVIPYPIELNPSDQAYTQGDFIGIFGSVRKEQGRSTLKTTIDVISSLGLRSLGQDPSGVLSSYLPSSAETVPFIDDFGNELKRCQAVLLNYDPQPYRFMGSGIFWEALARGIPVLCSRATSMAHHERRFGLNLSFSYNDKYSMKNALLRLQEDRQIYRAKTVAVADQIKQAKGLDRYAEAVLRESL